MYLAEYCSAVCHNNLTQNQSKAIELLPIVSMKTIFTLAMLKA